MVATTIGAGAPNRVLTQTANTIPAGSATIAAYQKMPTRPIREPAQEAPHLGAAMKPRNQKDRHGGWHGGSQYCQHESEGRGRPVLEDDQW